MKIKRFVRTAIILMILISNIGCDQISKHIVRERIDYREEISLIHDHLTLTRIENTGAFLSLGHSLPQPVKFLLLSVFPLTVLLLSLIYLFAKKDISLMTSLGICFVVGGGIGNIFDRIVYGSVTDFAHIDFGFFQTGIFNMADVSVMTGMCIVLYETYFNRMVKYNATGERNGD